MAHYFYFAASLPSISFDSKLPMTCEDFLSDSERLLSHKDFEVLSSVIADKASMDVYANAVIDSWSNFQRNLSNEIVVYRAKTMNKDAVDYLRQPYVTDPVAAEVVGQAAKALSPLEGEMIVDRLRWSFLDELAVSQHYTFEYVVLYGLQLKILEKYEEIRSSRGQEIFSKLKEVDLSDKF